MILFYNFLAVLFFALLFLFCAKKYDKTEKIIYIKLEIYNFNIYNYLKSL